MTLEEVVNEEIKRITDNWSRGHGLVWYDGISWHPELSNEDADEAYRQVFAFLRENGRKYGVKDPIIHHNGNGNYVVCERDTERSGT